MRWVVEHSPFGMTVHEEARIPPGLLHVETDYNAVFMSEDMNSAGYSAVVRRATLDGLLITDPARAQAYATEAGFPDPPSLMHPSGRAWLVPDDGPIGGHREG